MSIGSKKKKKRQCAALIYFSTINDSPADNPLEDNQTPNNCRPIRQGLDTTSLGKKNENGVVTHLTDHPNHPQHLSAQVEPGGHFSITREIGPRPHPELTRPLFFFQ